MLTTKPISQRVEKFDVLDIERILETLQLKGFHDCDRIPKADVKYALIKWFNMLVEDIETDPDWFITHFHCQEFCKHLPEPYETEYDPSESFEKVEF